MNNEEDEKNMIFSFLFFLHTFTSIILMLKAQWETSKRTAFYTSNTRLLFAI